MNNVAETWLAMAKAPAVSSEMRADSAVPSTLAAMARPSSTSSGQARLNMGGVRTGARETGMGNEVLPKCASLQHVEAVSVLSFKFSIRTSS